MYPDLHKKHSRLTIFLYRKYLWICNCETQLFECFQFILVSNYKNFGSLKKVTCFLVVASSLLLFLQRSFSLKDSGFHKGWFLVSLYFFNVDYLKRFKIGHKNVLINDQKKISYLIFIQSRTSLDSLLTSAKNLQSKNDCQ